MIAPTPRPPARRRTRVLVALAGVALSGVLVSGCGDASDDTGAQSADTAATDAVATLMTTGLAQLEAGDTAAAKGTFTSVLTLDPDHLYAHYNLGLIAQRTGDETTARTEYEAAIAADDGFAPAVYNRAILEEATDLTAAVELYQQATEADPTFAPAFMRMGFALVHLGRDADGERALGTGVELDPSMAQVTAPTYEP